MCATSAVGAAIVNAVAGGGTLITFPTMTALGVPAISANATNTVSLSPGYVAGTFAQRADLGKIGEDRKAQLLTSAVGGLVGSLLLVLSSEAVFRAVVPFLILGASLMLAVQVRLRRMLMERRHYRVRPGIELGAIGLVSVYGGYFGAGLGIMLLAVLGLLSEGSLTQVNAVKQLLSVAVNASAATFLAFSGEVTWSLVLVMAPAALLGGHLGGRLASVLPARELRAFVVVFGIVVAIVYWIR